MSKKSSVFSWILAFGIGIFVLPVILGAFGIPGFEAVLTALFGEGNPWAIVFSVLVIVLVVLITNMATNRGEQDNV